MAQLTGSGFGHGTNYAMVNDAGRLWVETSVGTNTQTEILRDSATTASAWYEFTQVMDGFMLDCIGSNPLYYAMSGTLSVTGSETGFLDTYNSISLDLQIGSIQIKSSGTSNTEFQLTGLI